MITILPFSSDLFPKVSICHRVSMISPHQPFAMICFHVPIRLWLGKENGGRPFCRFLVFLFLLFCQETPTKNNWQGRRGKRWYPGLELDTTTSPFFLSVVWLLFPGIPFLVILPGDANKEQFARKTREVFVSKPRIGFHNASFAFFHRRLFGKSGHRISLLCSTHSVSL